MRRRGQHGHPKEISYYQISSTDFAQKTSYGDGGIAGFNEVGSGYGGVVIHNTTTNTNITSTIARFGNQPGGGGGGIGFKAFQLKAQSTIVTRYKSIIPASYYYNTFEKEASILGQNSIAAANMYLDLGGLHWFIVKTCP
ncbi:MAG: hypothetical protein IPK46_12765 [Saprospiraceae bacterium]|nr:hypothetical protein [Saprospiraceae bacterium]